MTTPPEILVLEKLALRAWPALEETELDGWVLRFTQGYTRRSNSVQALERGKRALEEKIQACGKLYAERGLPTIFKVTPLAGSYGLDAHLAGRGYVLEAATSVQTLDLGNAVQAETPDLFMEEGWTQAWQDLFAAWSALPPGRHPLLAQILQRVQGRAFFGTLVHGKKPVACASGVLDGEWLGIYEVVTAPEERGKGNAKRMVEGLKAWAVGRGAGRAYLQVMESNAPALALYRSAGFREAYPYHYRVQARSDRA